MEHRHGCVYCTTLWFCHEDCPLDGPSVCEDCRAKLLDVPETPHRVVPLGPRVLARLAQYDADRIRQALSRRQRPQ